MVQVRLRTDGGLNHTLHLLRGDSVLQNELLALRDQQDELSVAEQLVEESTVKTRLSVNEGKCKYKGWSNWSNNDTNWEAYNFPREQLSLQRLEDKSHLMGAAMLGTNGRYPMILIIDSVEKIKESRKKNIGPFVEVVGFSETKNLGLLSWPVLRDIKRNAYRIKDTYTAGGDMVVKRALEGEGFGCVRKVMTIGIRAQLWCGFSILFECPVDLSALSVFSPIPRTASSSSTPVSDNNNNLIRAVLWYKTVASLHLWDPSSFDAVLISSPWALIGLPFLTRKPGFSSSTKIYATDLTVRLGRLIMEELVSLHMEYVMYYGPDNKPGWPDWMNWTELERLQMEAKRIILGEEREELSAWMPLYSAGDIKDCIDKIQPLRLGEEACFNGVLVMKALSSGLEIGSCNWSIKSPKGSLAYLSSSVFGSAHAMAFDYLSLTGQDAIIFSDFSSLSYMDSDEENAHNCGLSGESEDQSVKDLAGADEIQDESEKMHFICSCIVNSVKDGGSVLIPSCRFGVVLPLVEHIYDFLGSLNMKVPIYIISETAQETLTLANSVPEWLSKQRQEKLFSGEALFRHVELIKEGIITVSPFLYSTDLLGKWKEPCIVISPHWSLRLGSAVQLLQRWHSDPRSLLILEEGMHPELALMPFKPVKNEGTPVFLPIWYPLPESLRCWCPIKESELYKILYYSKNETAHIPSLKEGFEAYLATDLAFQLKPVKLPEKNMAAARLKGKLLLRKGVYSLALPDEPLSMLNKPSLYWGNVDSTRLMQVLNEKEIDGLILHNENSDFCVHVTKPAEALIEVKSNNITVSCKDEAFSGLIYVALKSILKGI